MSPRRCVGNWASFWRFINTSSYSFLPEEEEKRMKCVPFCVSAYTYVLLSSICVWSPWLMVAIQAAQSTQGKIVTLQGAYTLTEMTSKMWSFFFSFLFNRNTNCAAGWEHVGMAALAVEGKSRSRKYQTSSSFKVHPSAQYLLWLLFDAQLFCPWSRARAGANAGCSWWRKPQCSGGEQVFLFNDYFWITLEILEFWSARWNFSFQRSFEITYLFVQINCETAFAIRHQVSL